MHVHTGASTLFHKIVCERLKPCTEQESRPRPPIHSLRHRLSFSVEESSFFERRFSSCVVLTLMGVSDETEEGGGGGDGLLEEEEEVEEEEEGVMNFKASFV